MKSIEWPHWRRASRLSNKASDRQNHDTQTQPASNTGRDHLQGEHPPVDTAPTAREQFEIDDGSVRSSAYHGLGETVYTWWLWELSALVLSTLAMLALFITLVYFNGRRLPTKRFGITFNGLIAIYALIAKASLVTYVAECLGQLKWNRFSKKAYPLAELEVFDLASRGPWGSLRLLHMLKMP
jgi:hypothetical protein